MKSQPLFLENFDYPSGSLLVNNGWIAHSASGFNRIIVTFTHLDYPGYPPNVGNSVMLTGSGEDLHKNFNSTSYGPVYVSFLVRVLSADTFESYFLHLSRNPFLASIFRAKVFVKSLGIGVFDFGISKEADQGTYTGNTYSCGQTYLVVVKYRLFSGSNNDAVSLFVFDAPTLPYTEPPPTVNAVDNSAEDIGDVGSVSLRQGGISNTPELEIDGIRVATSWSQAPLPVLLSSFHGMIAQGIARLEWTTTREVGSHGFEVERSEDGIGWSRCGFVPAGGSLGGGSYRFEEDTRAMRSPMLWYRLRLIDNDGLVEYSNALPLAAASSVPDGPALEIAPQPVIKHAVVRFSVPREDLWSARLYDAAGRPCAVFFEGQRLQAGRHTLAVDIPRGLTAGMYLLVIRSAGGSVTGSPVIVLR